MKNKASNLITLLSVTGIMFLSAGAVSADTVATGSKQNVADLNNDGMVTSEEVVTYVQMNYSKINNNGDAFNAKEVAELDEIFDIDG